MPCVKKSLKELSEACGEIKIKYSGCCIGGVKISESASAKEYFLHWTDNGALFIYPENNDTPMKLKLDGYGGLLSTLNKDFYVEFKFCNPGDEAKVFKILKNNYNKAKMSKIKYIETSVCIVPYWPIVSPLYNVPVRVYTRTGDFVNFYYKNSLGDMTCLPTSISEIRDKELVKLNGITYVCKLEIKGV